MALRVGQVEFKATQRAEALEARRLLSLGAPGMVGAVHQDLGREPVVLLVEGLIYGPGAAAAVESLRGAFLSGTPQSFAADVVVGTELTDVIIEDLRVHQVAGTRDRYSAALRLREHTEPPEPPGLGLDGVLSDVVRDAAQWMELGAAAMRVAQDPSRLWAELRDNPGLRDRVGADAIEGWARDRVGDLTGLDPEEVQRAFEEFQELAEEGADAFEDFAALVEQGPQLLDELIALGGAAGALAEGVGGSRYARGLAGEGLSVLDRLFTDLRAVVTRAQALLDNEGLDAFVRVIARRLGLGREWNSALRNLGEGLDTLAGWLRERGPELEDLHALVALVELISPALGGVGRGVGALTGQIAALGAPLPAGDVAGALGRVGPAMDEAAGWAKATLPTPEALEALASALAPALRDALLRHAVEGT